jgi:Helix-turn-helix domain
MLSAHDLAAMIGKTPKTVRREWRRWRLSAYRVGGSLMFKTADVKAWLHEQKI